MRAGPLRVAARDLGRPVRRSWSPQAQYIALAWRVRNLNRKLDALEESNMAKITWRGETFSAKPIQQNSDGSWLMEALQHTGRTAPGTRITVFPAEIVKGTLDAPEIPAGADNGQAALDAGMAAERKTLLTPAQIIAQAQTKTSESGTGAVPPGPTQAPIAAPASSQKQGTTSMTHLADKMKLLASGTQGFAQQLETLIDQKIAAHQATQTKVLGDINNAFATVDAINADAEAGVAAIQAALKDLTNQ